MTESSPQHIPYRNTALTKILKASIGGNSKTAIILCVSPAKSQFDQTLQTLKFGLSASGIENKVSKNCVKGTSEETLKILISEYQLRLANWESQPCKDSQVPALQAQIRELKAENAKLIEQLHRVRENESTTDDSCVSIDKCMDSLKSKCEQVVELTAANKELRTQLLSVFYKRFIRVSAKTS